MQPAELSQTALLAAVARGQHRLTYRRPWILDDPYALSLVGPAWEESEAGLRAVFPDRVREEAISGIVAPVAVCRGRARGGQVRAVRHPGRRARLVCLAAGPARVDAGVRG